MTTATILAVFTALLMTVGVLFFLIFGVGLSLLLDSAPHVVFWKASF